MLCYRPSSFFKKSSCLTAVFRIEFKLWQFIIFYHLGFTRFSPKRVTTSRYPSSRYCTGHWEPKPLTKATSLGSSNAYFANYKDNQLEYIERIRTYIFTSYLTRRRLERHALLEPGVAFCNRLFILAWLDF